MNIGFDLDRIFIDTPPLIPDWIIDKLYKEKDNGVLLYRVPGTLEQKVRQFSHTRYLRPVIRKNIDILKQLAQSKKNNIFLISSRFGFLQKQTEKLMKKYQLDTFFHSTYFNYDNEQPHEFKNRMIKEKQIDLFIDDDLSLLKYLAQRNHQKKFYWLNDKVNDSVTGNLYAITKLQKILPYALD